MVVQYIIFEYYLGIKKGIDDEETAKLKKLEDELNRLKEEAGKFIFQLLAIVLEFKGETLK